MVMWRCQRVLEGAVAYRIQTLTLVFHSKNTRENYIKEVTTELGTLTGIKKGEGG